MHDMSLCIEEAKPYLVLHYLPTLKKIDCRILSKRKYFWESFKYTFLYRKHTQFFMHLNKNLVFISPPHPSRISHPDLRFRAHTNEDVFIVEKFLLLNYFWSHTPPPFGHIL